MGFITLRDVKKIYRAGDQEVPVLKGISLEIGRGEFVALMGSSGSGKSTLMNILGCLDRPTSGSYTFEDREVSALTSDERAWLRNEKMGFVFQSFHLLSRTSALENVQIPLSYSRKGVSDRESRRVAEQLLERVGLKDRMHHHPSQLSGGQQQRVAIARALVNSPSVLFADEPTGNLDTVTSQEVLDMFTELNTAQGITVVFVTHEGDVAARARRVIRMRDGRLEGDA